MCHARLVLLALPIVGVLGAVAAAPGQVTPPGGTTPSGKILDRLREDVQRPGPAAPAPPRAPAPDMIWVPDRYVRVPGVQGEVFVPGHWERRVSEHEVHVPPLTGRTDDGQTIQWPAGTYRLPHERQSP
jgi:hypothetical protein